MLTYTFSRREKVLIGLFAALLVVIAWYQMVYVTTTEHMRSIEAEIEVVEQNITELQVKLANKKEMERIIAERIAEGVQPKHIPYYDNLKPLMKELDGIMSKARSYSLSFDAMDTEETEYILRGVGMKFGCESFKEADGLVRAIADGTYPCIIDSVSISTTNKEALLVNKETTASVMVSVHVIFYERSPSTAR